MDNRTSTGLPKFPKPRDMHCIGHTDFNSRFDQPPQTEYDENEPIMMVGLGESTNNCIIYMHTNDGEYWQSYHGKSAEAAPNSDWLYLQWFISIRQWRIAVKLGIYSMP